MSEEAFSVTLWACSAYAAVTPAVGMSNRCCLRLLYLDPTYCQISSTLHISLSELEQVALYFTSPHSGAWTASNPAAQRLHRRPTPAIGGATPAIGGATPPMPSAVLGAHFRSMTRGSPQTALAWLSVLWDNRNGCSASRTVPAGGRHRHGPAG